MSLNTQQRHFPSLSARRAWIEITYVTRLPRAQVVALRKESVDRNMLIIGTFRSTHNVALRKESVDRNARKIRSVAPDICRSPQGERG